MDTPKSPDQGSRGWLDRPRCPTCNSARNLRNTFFTALWKCDSCNAWRLNAQNYSTFALVAYLIVSFLSFGEYFYYLTILNSQFSSRDLQIRETLLSAIASWSYVLLWFALLFYVPVEVPTDPPSDVNQARVGKMSFFQKLGACILGVAVLFTANLLLVLLGI